MERRVAYEEIGLGILIGLAAGLAAGLLVAPRSGIATRETIAHRAADLKVSAQELMENARHSLDAASTKLEGVLGIQERALRKRLRELKAELEEYDLSGA